MSNTSAPWHEGLEAQNLPQLFQEKLQRADAVFAPCDDGRVFTYQAFWNLAGRIANALAASGARRGDRIAVQVDKSIEAIVLFWACARAGFVFLPLNTAYTESEISYFLGDAEPSVFVTVPAREAAMSQVAQAAGCTAVLTLSDAAQGSLADSLSLQAADFADAPCGWDDIAAILYTSGTTGRSKGAMLSHGNLASNALALAQLWRFTAADKLLHALPVYHTHGLFTATNTVLLSGGQLLFRRKFNADDIMALMPQATSMMGVPTFYTRLLQHPGLTREATSHMRLFISGSAPLLAETHHEFEQRTGHAILERYGMTETSMIASNPYDGQRRAGTVGMALPFVSVRVANPADGTPLPDGTDGMIEVKGPNVFRGYWRNPQKTAEDMRGDGYFITGDVGRIDGQGYLVISGRAKDLVITGGFNVYPKEVEELIDALPGVLESAVIGLPHADFGEAVTAVVVPAHGASVSEDQILGAIRGKLASFKQPKRVLVIPELPRNTMGKVQKAELRKRYAALYQA